MFDTADTRSITNKGEIQELKEGGGDTDVGAAAIPTARETSLPLHLLWIDVREGREDTLDANARRAARLFRRFIRRACGDTDTGVSTSRGSCVLSSDRAKDILAAEDELPASGKAKTIKRVYQRAQSMTKREDCACDSLEGCRHGLLDAEKKKGQWRLRAAEEPMHEYLRTVEAAISGDAPPAADDDVSTTSEAPTAQPDEIDDELDALDAATPATDGVTADDGVSSVT